MRFLVFVPAATAAERTGRSAHPTFEDVGLECLLGPGEPSPDMAECDSFPPAGQAGRIYGWPQGMDGLPVYQPADQTWIAAAPDPDRKLAAKRYWLGLWNSSPPTAEDLERPSVVFGRMQLKASSGLWQVPSLLNLPCGLELDDATGRPVRVPKPEHAGWRADAAWALDLTLKLLRGESDTWPEAQAFECAVRLLQLNYRLPRELVHRLGLLSDEHVLKTILLRAADANEIDAALFEFESKKNGPVMAGCSTSNAGGGG